MNKIITDNSKVNQNLLNEVKALNKQNKELIVKNMDLQEQLRKLQASDKASNCILGAVISRFNSDIFIDNVCLSYIHDFGLIAEQDKQRLRFECKEWMRAISNNWEYFKNGL